MFSWVCLLFNRNQWADATNQAVSLLANLTRISELLRATRDFVFGHYCFIAKHYQDKTQTFPSRRWLTACAAGGALGVPDTVAGGPGPPYQVQAGGVRGGGVGGREARAGGVAALPVEPQARDSPALFYHGFLFLLTNPG
jgi:hypothetical protein